MEQAVYPAFFSLYVAKERRSSVQAMQLSNGLSDPVGLWLGHLLFDSMFAVVVASLIVIVFAAASNQFHGLGFFVRSSCLRNARCSVLTRCIQWVVLVLYGVVGALFSYCVSLIVASPLAAFALSAGYQVIMFVVRLPIFRAYILLLSFLCVAVSCCVLAYAYLRQDVRRGNRSDDHSYVLV